MVDEANDADGERGKEEKDEEEEGIDVADEAAAMIEGDHKGVVIIVGDDAEAQNDTVDRGGDRGGREKRMDC